MRQRVRNFFKNMNTSDQNTSSSEEQVNSPEEQMIPDSEAYSDQPESPDVLAQEMSKEDNWKAKYEEMNDKYLRLYSEFDNFRKRSARERVDFAKTAASDIFTAILPILDDFDRASKAMEAATDVEVVKEGMSLIHNKLFSLMQQKGLEPMESAGMVFDSELHEAITSIPGPDESMKGKVVDVLEKGYSLNGKVIRFAKVVVGS